MIAGLRVVAVVAMARNRVIGAGGTMPWHLPSELKRFRALTDNRPMIMGRRTLDSIGRLLPGRDTIVLSRADTVEIAGAVPARTPAQALDLATAAAKRRGAHEIAIVGGAEIYSIFMPVTDRVYLTRVDIEPAGDTELAPFERDFDRVETGPIERGERDSASYRTERWDRRPETV